MANVIRISEKLLADSPPLGPFSLAAYYTSFLGSPLGQIYRALPWEELVHAFELSDKKKGPLSTFPPRGKIALMFLKNYLGLSDEKLLEALSGNLDYQFFCGILIDPSHRLRDRRRVSEIRGQLAHRLSIEEIQRILASHWKAYMPDRQAVLMDATCYESEVRYPTDIKLLWESIDWLFKRIRMYRRGLGLPMIRSRYKKWKRRKDQYSRKQKPRKKNRRSLRAGLLRLLDKFLGAWEEIESEYVAGMDRKDLARIHTIQTLYKQQWAWFYQKTKPTGRIVSLAKPYLRPIVRGKEKKPVEFGAKVNKIQIDGINFIELIHFEAFHEGNRLQASVHRAYSLGKKKIKRLAADRIYATNANRRFCTNKHIFTDFLPKGRKAKDEAQRKILRKALTKERASRLEGSFGNEKNAFHLRKIRARTKKNEILWIFFGIHTANAREIGKRMAA